MVDEFVKSDISGRSAAVQTGAAVALVAGALGAMWGLGVFDHHTPGPGRPAACAAPKAGDSPEYPALCAALNRPDLPTLLGRPEDYVSVAQSGGGAITLADGTKEYDASAEVQVGTFNVRVTDNRHLSVRDTTALAGSSVSATTVLGHPCLTYSDRTIAFSLNSEQPSTGPGGIARHLVVAKGPKAGGGSFEITVWRQDGSTPDDQALFLIADKVLPTLAGWS
ncbi:hypothetical protein ABIA32_006522 [Streptacidiphilus sp. MAP12-20]|uniref:DUF6215 domain-containing protein n=1 Tax=Streptacidiphilus sp. MAP12-20 TaxID=3156299 RepID=UPI003518FEF9